LTHDTSTIYTHASNIDRSNTVLRLLILSSFVLATAAHGHDAPPGRQLRDVDGVTRNPFVPSGTANVLFFVTSDCPVSNRYAPEIQRQCAAYGRKGVFCLLVYEDTALDAAAVRRHRDSFGYRDIPAVIDTAHAIAATAHATVTPEAVVVTAGGEVRYRGRIDDRYEALGKPRRVVTAHDLQDALDAVLTRRPVVRPVTEAVGCFIPSGNPRSAAR
jgi:hypothetical protein